MEDFSQLPAEILQKIANSSRKVTRAMRCICKSWDAAASRAQFREISFEYETDDNFEFLSRLRHVLTRRPMNEAVTKVDISSIPEACLQPTCFALGTTYPQLQHVQLACATAPHNIDDIRFLPEGLITLECCMYNMQTSVCSIALRGFNISG